MILSIELVYGENITNYAFCSKLSGDRLSNCDRTSTNQRDHYHFELAIEAGCNAYAAQIAAQLGAHIIKVKLPTEHIEQDAARKVYEKEQIEIATLPDRVAHVVQCSFNERRIVILRKRRGGGTDFQGGDAGLLYDTVTQRLFTLPDCTSVYPAHDYQGRTVSTIGEEKRLNSRFADRTREQFMTIMSHLGLSYPKKMKLANK